MWIYNSASPSPPPHILDEYRCGRCCCGAGKRMLLYTTIGKRFTFCKNSLRKNSTCGIHGKNGTFNDHSFCDWSNRHGSSGSCRCARSEDDCRITGLHWKRTDNRFTSHRRQNRRHCCSGLDRSHNSRLEVGTGIHQLRQAESKLWLFRHLHWKCVAKTALGHCFLFGAAVVDGKDVCWLADLARPIF